MGLPALLKTVWKEHKEGASKESKEVQAEFKRVPDFIGTVCDPIGFRQHSGECAADSLQQLLLFTDDWKAKTQPLFYTMTPEIFARQLERMSFRLPIKIIELLEDFAKNIQMRFRLHYNIIGTTKHALNESVCITPFAYRKFLIDLEKADKGLPSAMVWRKRRLSANLGKGASTALKELQKAEYRISDWFNVIWDFCGLPHYEILFRERHTLPSRYTNIRPNYNHVAFYLGSKVIDTRTPLQDWNWAVDREYTGHATAIYSCDGKWVYYDNNRGIMPIDQKLMADLLNEVGQFYIFWTYQKKAILFYKVDVKTRSKWSLLHWHENKWRKLPLDTLEQYRIGEEETRATRTKKPLFSLYRTIHIATNDWSTPGFNGNFIDDHTGPDLGWEPRNNSPSPVIGPVPPTPPASPVMLRRASPVIPVAKRVRSATRSPKKPPVKGTRRRASHG